MIDRKQAPSFIGIKEGACFLSYFRLSKDNFTHSPIHLHGSGDELLHLLSSQRRSLRDYLYLIVGDVRRGVKRQL